MYKPLHPGILLRRLLVNSWGLTVQQAAERLGEDPAEIADVLAGNQLLNPDLIRKVSNLTGTTEAVWKVSQSNYEKSLPR
jgi:plasmid maintenance system antidote protein VapI